jgi:glycosyltransferase involved in cell wall biosynthesis
MLCYLAGVSRVLIVANDVVALRMAGPGIRCFELGRSLAADGHQVTLVGVGATDLRSPGLTVMGELGSAALDHLAGAQDLIILEGLALVRYPTLAQVRVPLVVDLYDPFPIALLGQEEHLGMPQREREDAQVRQAVRDLLRLGDFFVCASETQRDLWLGSLLAEGRLNPRTWSEDPTFRQLIDVVPFGLPSTPPPTRASRARLPLPGIDPGDLVLLWGGGIYNWFDPLTLIEALARTEDVSPPVKLVFMSTSHPNSGIPPKMWMTRRAVELSDQLGLTGRRVYFNTDWVPYQERGSWLAGADCGVSTHFDNAETHFAFRTRLLDYLWAGLPIICTQGDHFASLVKEHHLGWTVPARDPLALEHAIREMARDGARREEISARVRSQAAELTWEGTTAPLRSFTRAPRGAPDAPRSPGMAAPARGSLRLTPAEVSQLLRRAVAVWRREGARSTLRRARAWWRRRQSAQRPTAGQR